MYILKSSIIKMPPHLVQLAQLLQCLPVGLLLQPPAVGEVPSPKVEKEDVIGLGHGALQHLQQTRSLHTAAKTGFNLVSFKCVQTQL
jgi:hypothetical protein